jgi:YacP-like NYN domain
MSGADEPDVGDAIETPRLRSAIEFAVLVAEETQKRKPPMAVPNQVKAFFGKPRIPAAALGRLRRAIEADPVFRERLAAGALPELVDEVGRLWLQRPAGWEADAMALVAHAERRAAEADAVVLLGRADKRRRAAEDVAARARAEVVRLSVAHDEQQLEIDRLRADLVKADDTVAEMRAELLDVRNEARHARDRENAAVAKLARATAELDGLRSQPPPAEVVGVVEHHPVGTVLTDDVVRDLIESARHAAETSAATARAVEELLGGRRGADGSSEVQARRGSDAVPGAAPSVRRRPLALPGGVIATSAEAAAHLARSDASMLIDGYNVAMLGRPRLTLPEQRSWLVDAVENVVRRFGTDATIVFDGADVVGSHTPARRSTRVVFSPAGVIADDVIRDEIDRLPGARHVVVVTNDAELARDARARGANVVPSNALLALL